MSGVLQGGDAAPAPTSLSLVLSLHSSDLDDVPGASSLLSHTQCQAGFPLCREGRADPAE